MAVPRPVLPEIPRLEPRPFEGDAPEQTFRVAREGAEQTPVGGFVDTLQGNDAAIQLVLGQSRLLTTKASIIDANGVPVISVGDPTVVDFDVLPLGRTIRLLGRRAGVTDLTVITADGQPYSFEIHVGYDLELLRAHLKQMFPDAFIRLGQIREHVVLEGQARSPAQSQQIADAVRLYLASVHAPQGGGVGGDSDAAAYAQSQQGSPDDGGEGSEGESAEANGASDAIVVEETGRMSGNAASAASQVINLLQVPGVQQVLLKVQLAEVNRRAIREIGADLTLDTGGTFLQSIAAGEGNLLGIFSGGEFTVVMKALRQNNVASILAEPNLVTLSGHEANFQSGGEFPVPVAQQGGGAGNNSVEFKPFGVQLSFVPYVEDDGVIRLYVAPEVSTVDESLSVSLIAGGSPVPGVRTRNASTTVELHEGQTLAIAGLLNNEKNGLTKRVPLLGDLPYVGPWFSNTSHDVIEQELLVAVTPYLVSPMDSCQQPALPGSDVTEPTDLEFYLLNRIEGRLGFPHRATTNWANPLGCHTGPMLEMESTHVFGPVGLTQ